MDATAHPAQPQVRSSADLRRLLEDGRNGDGPARARLVELAMPLVRSLARRYVNRGERFEDLVQVGAVGLIKAIDRFDPERGDDFFRFAVPTITGEIKHHLRDLSRVVRAPRSVVELSGSLERREPGLAPPLSLSRSSDGSSELTAALVLDAPYEACDDRLLLAVGFRTLAERERRILHLRYFAGLSQAEIASELGLSQVHVSRLLRGSLERLNAALAVRQPPPASSAVAS